MDLHTDQLAHDNVFLMFIRAEDQQFAGTELSGLPCKLEALGQPSFASKSCRDMSDRSISRGRNASPTSHRASLLGSQSSEWTFTKSPTATESGEPIRFWRRRTSIPSFLKKRMDVAKVHKSIEANRRAA
jgi:hypothetical protein